MIRAFLNGATRQDEVLPPQVIVEPTRGTETSHYPEEKKEKSILKVVASEIGTAQTSYSNMWRVRTLFRTENDSGRSLERLTEGGNSPVREIV